MQFNIETGSKASQDLRVAFLGFCIRNGYLNGQPKVQLGEDGLDLSFEADACGVLKELPDNISGDERFPMIVKISGRAEYEKILEIMLDIHQRNFTVIGCKLDTEGEDGNDNLKETKLELTFKVSIAALEKHLLERKLLLDNSRSVKPKAKSEKTPPDKEKMEELMNIVGAPGTTEMMMLKNVGDFLGIAGEGEDIVILLQAYTDPENLTTAQRKELGKYLAPVFGNNKRIASTMAKIRKAYEAANPKDNTHPEGGDQKGCNPEPDADKEDHHT